jgi:hypothetical protein
LSANDIRVYARTRARSAFSASITRYASTGCARRRVRPTPAHPALPPTPRQRPRPCRSAARADGAPQTRNHQRQSASARPADAKPSTASSQCNSTGTATASAGTYKCYWTPNTCRAVGQVAVPFGVCAEPSRVRRQPRRVVSRGGRHRVIRQFVEFTNEYRWQWRRPVSADSSRSLVGRQANHAAVLQATR